ncbi:hypothetical protein BT96DRAFT_966300 [Gymnopus androsaceus JB14]|uniref:Photolyase/cryptochrome alpha/beta domain-containing protein n=1 Tax=Gymnopus androsaceus JB14 TaxID=1447944 RepID=A0A6A4HF76_9AGAR|nr:hypothetical protein BT96DRAFT_966300 [Gymnopus androsaceus JB14]
MLRLFFLAPQRPILRFTMPSKRARSTSVIVKKTPNDLDQFLSAPRKVASAQNAAAVDAEPPLAKLLEAVKGQNQQVKKGKAVVYWMRMADLRISDNHALSLASTQAKKEEIPLVVLFVISPQDYKAHDRGARRIDFTLRNLTQIKDCLAELNIPLHIITHNIRKTLPGAVLSLLRDWGCTNLYGNIEYEVDELRRDIQVCALGKSQGISANFVHNKCIIEPGVITTKESKAYSVYSPYQRNWISTLNGHLDQYLKNFSEPHPNADGIREDPQLSKLFETKVPISVPGFELEEHDRDMMSTVWPAGEDSARQILDRFLHTKSRTSQMGVVDPLFDGAEVTEKGSRIMKYHQDRDNADRDTTSRLSPYLSAGVISVRECVRATLKIQKSNKVDGSRESGIGRWVQELAWRDFYTCVLASFPRVSMGRPFLEKYAAVEWEDTKALKKWKDGMTGFPVVDAAMRCLKQTDLMIDWRVGERYFMEQLIDADLASNNGGWQWCASTGVDPCPYFRIFNPYTQSTKVDPTGDFIRQFVPELSKLRGPDLHNPSASAANKLGYPQPIVKHDEARQRALQRFKEVGK